MKNSIQSFFTSWTIACGCHAVQLHTNYKKNSKCMRAQKREIHVYNSIALCTSYIVLTSSPSKWPPCCVYIAVNTNCLCLVSVCIEWKENFSTGYFEREKSWVFGSENLFESLCDFCVKGFSVLKWKFVANKFEFFQRFQ